MQRWDGQRWSGDERRKESRVGESRESLGVTAGSRWRHTPLVQSVTARRSLGDPGERAVSEENENGRKPPYCGSFNLFPDETADGSVTPSRRTSIGVSIQIITLCFISYPDEKSTKCILHESRDEDGIRLIGREIDLVTDTSVPSVLGLSPVCSAESVSDRPVQPLFRVETPPPPLVGFHSGRGVCVFGHPLGFSLSATTGS